MFWSKQIQLIISVYLNKISGAKLRSEAAGIEHSSTLLSRQIHQASELAYRKSLDFLEIDKRKQMTEIEVSQLLDSYDVTSLVPWTLSCSKMILSSSLSINIL